MSKFLKYGVFFLVLLVTVLVVSKPTEQDFFDQIVSDYSQVHPDFELSKADLASMGSTQYHSQLIYSSYSYKFGGIEVHYWGMFGYIINSGYETEFKNEEKSTTTDVLG